MTYNIDKVREFLASEGGMTSFLEWLGNPVTQLLLAAARERARPRAPYPPFTADYRLGETKGAFDIIDFISSPAIGPDKDEPPALYPTYSGSEEDK